MFRHVCGIPASRRLRPCKKTCTKFTRNTCKKAQNVYGELFKKRAVTAAKIGFSPYSFEAGSLPFHTAETIAPVLAFWPPQDWRCARGAGVHRAIYARRRGHAERQAGELAAVGLA